MRAQFAFAILFSAVLSGIFSFGSNYISGVQMIGWSTMAGITIGLAFGAIGGFLVTLASWLCRKDGNLFFAATGIFYGAAIYIANCLLGTNAGFALFGLVFVSAFGLMSGFGSLASARICHGLARLQQLS